jgi:hypothetical protein
LLIRRQRQMCIRDSSGGSATALGGTTGSANGSSKGTDIGVRHSF